MRLTLAGLVAAWLLACGGEPRPAPATIPQRPARAAQAAPDPAANAAWTEAGFDARLLAAIRSRFPQAAVTALEADRYRIAAAPPGPSLDVEFARADDSCRGHWASCQAAVDWTLQAVAEAMQPPPITAAQLRAILRANSKVASYRTQGE